MSKIFKVKEYSENDKFEFKFRKKIETRIINISSEWKMFSNVQKKWKTFKLRFDSESNEKFIQLNNEICPSLEIDYFSGVYVDNLPIKVQKRKREFLTDIKNEMILQSINSQKEEQWGEEPLII